MTRHNRFASVHNHANQVKLDEKKPKKLRGKLRKKRGKKKAASDGNISPKSPR